MKCYKIRAEAPNKKYREEWERIFGKKKKKDKPAK